MVTYRLPLNSRVKLRDGIDPALYNGFTCTGNEGWIRDHRADEHDYAQVQIEWDHDHWAYNGAPNCWTWESHFDLVEEQMSETENTKPTLSDLLIQAAQAATELEAGRGTPAEEPTPGIEDKSNDVTPEALDALTKSKAFILITVQEGEQEGRKLIYPAIFQQADTEQWALICQGHVGHLLTLFHDSMLQEKLVQSQSAE